MKNEPNSQPESGKLSQASPLGECSKVSLLRYMAIMFAVAFILVLLSYLIQMRNSQSAISRLSQSSASAFANAEQLQSDNRALETALQVLEEKVRHQQETIDSLRDQKNSAETSTLAYENLLKLMILDPQEDADAYQKALTAVHQLQDSLSEDALSICEELLAETAQA